jgi:DNA-binding XRE family transcriptional regulator
MVAPRHPDHRLAIVLSRVRDEQQRTAERLALEADLVASTVTRIETERSDPTWTTVCALAEALELPLAELGRLVEAEGPR